jgi:hypothetical protein
MNDFVPSHRLLKSKKLGKCTQTTSKNYVWMYAYHRTVDMYIHRCMHIHIYIDVHTYIHTYIHTGLHSLRDRPYTHGPPSDGRQHIHRCMHIHTYMDVHAYIHTGLHSLVT